ncbi:MAG: YIP1 family protein [Actinobacteria bacterium]|nr:MAG: YIP1 family protein [Actinomycetota bacterium]
MDVRERREVAPDDDRAWLAQALLVLIDPRPVFAALRDDSDDSARARQEPVMAIVGLAGVASVLWTTVAGRLMDDPAFDGLVVAVWAFIGGAIYGIAVYFAVGAALYLGLRAAGSLGSYRRARHLLAFACAPLALSLVVWPVRLAVYGGDVFRTGGSDSGAGNLAFVAVELAFVAWAIVLLLAGTRTLHAWPWTRTLEGVGLAAAIPALLAILAHVVSPYVHLGD